jgi:hypothetical protein
MRLVAVIGQEIVVVVVVFFFFFFFLGFVVMELYAF